MGKYTLLPIVVKCTEFLKKNDVLFAGCPENGLFDTVNTDVYRPLF